MRIKINTNDIAKNLSAFRNLKPITYNLKPSRGFTLIELLVVISLFVALTTIALLNQSKFNGSILLTNLAYDVALTIRQAQSFGINVREAPGGGVGAFNYAYGVHFDNNKNKQFLLFVDTNDNKKYDGSWTCNGGSGDECLDNYNIKRGNYISDIRVTSSSDISCLNPTGCLVKKLYITFLRPDPDAKFKAKKISGGDVDNITDATIIISSADGNTRTVRVYSTGQIAVGR